MNIQKRGSLDRHVVVGTMKENSAAALQQFPGLAAGSVAHVIHGTEYRIEVTVGRVLPVEDRIVVQAAGVVTLHHESTHRLSPIRPAIRRRTAAAMKVHLEQLRRGFHEQRDATGPLCLFAAAAAFILGDVARNHDGNAILAVQRKVSRRILHRVNPAKARLFHFCSLAVDGQ